jgi:hypothetical protein
MRIMDIMERNTKMNFLLGVEYDVVSQCYVACFSEGEVIQLGANNYQDAVLEADMLDVQNYERGYN